ncbi:uncharacterized protein PAC_17955 [Phialocephala subalpina]|uniref:Glucose-methanol-choline oxidoreductase N-terminal domain-containing protein n=1 Tax=Phialocephala subalpina TaxID=576137 RepID=A0A1L7XSQ0_9HELO|nr:uncharacterized protein PAC_17955 [Phialocephala subalpina]
MTESQPQLHNNTVSYTRGKTLGGSSALNEMPYQRRTVGSYHAWADAVGDERWNFTNLLPFFEKSVKYTAPNARIRAASAFVPSTSSDLSSTEGLLHVSFPNYAAPFSSSSEASFLDDAFARNELFPNLAVHIHTLGGKIIFNTNKTATGVLVKSNGFLHLLNATKEVIISAGAFQSPQLLTVSGIGPKAELEKHNITVIADRPSVGQNISEAKADLATFPADWLDFEYVVLSFNSSTYLASNITYGTLEPALIDPLSRGNISVSSPSIDDPPIINVGWLTNATNLETAVIAIKRAREFWASDVMKGILVGEEVLPGKNVSTDEQILEWARGHVRTVYHASCTCKMGKVEDEMAVTDSRARVIVVNNLRVVDASTFRCCRRDILRVLSMP